LFLTQLSTALVIRSLIPSLPIVSLSLAAYNHPMTLPLHDDDLLLTDDESNSTTDNETESLFNESDDDLDDTDDTDDTEI